VKQAVILAGGKGTRLQSVIGGLPKPLADIGGVPLLGHQLRLLQRHSFTDAVVLVSHRADAIQAWLDTEPLSPGFRVTLVHDAPPRGTGGAILNVLSGLAEEFVVLYGDTMLDVDLDRLWAWHAAKPDTAASLFLHPNDHPHDSDLVEVDESGVIVGFHPYPHPEGAWLPNLVNAALYVFRRDALLPWHGLAGSLDIAKDLFPRMLDAGALLRGYVSSEYIKDAGTPPRLEKVRKAYADGTTARASLQMPQRAVFLDRDGTLNAAAGYIRNADQLQVFPGAGKAVRRLNDAEWRTVVVTNQPVIARGDTTPAELGRIHARLDTELARDGGFIDRLYYCPHHPDRGFSGEVAALKIACDCRKPGAGMIRQATADLNIDLTRSWMIGDSSADLGAAEAAGVQSILVETGDAGRDGRYPYEAGIVVPDVQAAVAFILDAYPHLVEAALPVLAGIGAGEDWFVGGLPRAGKSTFAAVLQRELRLRGFRCEVIQLDRWVSGMERRGIDVFCHTGITAAQQMVALATARGQAPAVLTMPTHSRPAGRGRPSTTTKTLTAETVVIWEGVIAVEVARRVDALNRSVHLESTRDSEARAVLREPEKGEYAAVQQLSDLASIRLNLAAALPVPAIEKHGFLS
jgi:histidinol-phosphate phosphatase family protein